ncbi:MAG: lipoyl synthase [Verrucomicrobiota bacterium]|nr:lipoyl synthase [Verrucomicrobiota bacterium]
MPKKETTPPLRKPDWLRVRIGQGARLAGMRALVHGRGLHTVCEEALCPNIGTCWERGHATIMILGDRCTRSCRFCAVGSGLLAARQAGRPAPADVDEPRRVAGAVQAARLSHVVLTSVTRDDLPDGGAGIWAETIRLVREACPGAVVEALVPDFGGSAAAFETVARARPDVFGHNLETVASLYPRVRPASDYRRSLDLLRRAGERGLIAKTGVMLGVGETPDEVAELMRDALAVGCEILYIGQYLRPTRRHLQVRRYVEPAEFEAIRRTGIAIGFPVIVAGPLVRSSYPSGEQDARVRRRLAGQREKTR